MPNPTDEVVDMVYQVAEAICKKKGYQIKPSRSDVMVTLWAIMLIRDTAEKEG